MNILSITEFKNLCDKLSPREIIVSSDNQNMDLVEYGINYSLTFSTINVLLNPSLIYLKNKNDSYIQFGRIKHIKQYKNSLLGNVFDIVCTGFLDTNNESSHTVIIR